MTSVTRGLLEWYKTKQNCARDDVHPISVMERFSPTERPSQPISSLPNPLVFDSVSLLPPTYSLDLMSGEQTVEYTPNGTFIKKVGSSTLFLANQEAAASIPCYGRHAAFEGSIRLDHSANIVEVYLKVRKRLFYYQQLGAALTVRLS